MKKWMTAAAALALTACCAAAAAEVTPLPIDLSGGLPQFTMVGLPDSAVK